MIRASTFEVTIEVGGKTEIEGIYPDDKTALERAEYLLKQAKYTAVRVHKVGARDNHKLIFEKFYSGSGVGATATAIDEAFLCLSVSDVYSFGSRQTLLRLLRAYVDQQLAIPLELLHDYMGLRYLERDALLFNQAAHRLAGIQAKSARVSANERHDTLIKLFRDVTLLAKDAPEGLGHLYRCLADRGLGTLIDEVTDTLPVGDHTRAITYALARHLGPARDWGLKLTAACELFSEEQSAQTEACLDEVLAEIIDGSEPVRSAIGYAPDLVTALEALLATVDGSWDNRLPGTTALQQLSDIMAHRPLPLVRQALLNRVAGALDGKVALTKGDRAYEAAALKRLVPKLTEFSGFMGGVPMSAALTRRAKTALGKANEDLSFEGTISILAGFLPTPAARIGFLLDLLCSDLGRRQAPLLTQSIAELFNSIRSIYDFAPDQDSSWSQDRVREDFRRRLYQAGIPRRLADGLLHRLAQLSDSPGAVAIAPAKAARPAAALPAPGGVAGVVTAETETQRRVPTPDVADLIGRGLLTHCGSQYLVEAAQTPFAIGRSESCQLTVDCGTASRCHAVIELTGTDFVLVDQSKNGTFIYYDDRQPAILNKASAVLTSSGLFTLGTTSDDPALTEQGMIRFQRVASTPR